MSQCEPSVSAIDRFMPSGISAQILLPERRRDSRALRPTWPRLRRGPSQRLTRIKSRSIHEWRTAHPGILDLIEATAPFPDMC